MSISTYPYSSFNGVNANLSLKPYELVCEIAYEFTQSKTLIFINAIQCLLSGATVVLLYLIFKTKELRRVYSIIDLDLKVGFDGCLKHSTITDSNTPRPVSYTIASINSTLFFFYKFVSLRFTYQSTFS